MLVLIGVLGGCRSPLYNPTAQLLQTHFPAASETVPLAVPEGAPGIRGIWKISNKDLLGHVVQVDARSRSGRFPVQVVIDAQHRVAAVNVPHYPHREGRGVLNPEFTEQFEGKTDADSLPFQIDAVSGATISSDAITEATAKALRVVAGISPTPSD